MNIITSLFLCFALLVLNAQNLRVETAQEKLALESEFPYQGLVFIDGLYRCGAALITRSHLLSVASCVVYVVTTRPVNSTVKIMLGTIRRTDGSVHNVKRISHHIAFSNKAPHLNLNDIAVIHLLHEVTISDTISPVQLPRVNDKVPVATVVVTSGFGSKSRNGSPSLFLSKRITLITPLGDCNKWYPSYFLLDTQICTLKKPGSGNNIGDLGSPMVDQLSGILLGIASVQSIDYHNDSPDIYTDVSFYIPYIKEEINYYNMLNGQYSLIISHPGVNFAWSTHKFLS